MKKYILSIPFFLLLLLLQNTVQAQPLTKKTLTPIEKGKLDLIQKTPVLPNITGLQKTKAENYANAITVFLAKALLHRSDPAKYPMDAPRGSMEKRSLDFVNTFSASQLQRATDRLIATIADPAKKATAFGKYKTLDFTKASTTGELKKMDNDLHFSKTPDLTMAPPLNRIEFIIKGLYCLQKTTSPESEDQIIIGGLLSGLHNEVFPATSLLAGEFSNGEFATGAFIFGGADLHPSETFPKKFYSYLLVIEYDGFDVNQDVTNLNSQMQSLANHLSGLEASEDFYHNYIAFSLKNAGEMHFWDDCLNLKEVPVTLSNNNAFGADKVSDDMNTGDIYGWGGRYQIVYCWRLIKN